MAGLVHGAVSTGHEYDVTGFELVGPGDIHSCLELLVRGARKRNAGDLERLLDQ